MLQRNLVWESEDDGRAVAKWDDVLSAYQIDVTSGRFRLMPKLTDFHVVRKKIKKMKVSYATQVFSHSVVAAIDIMARTSKKILKV